MKTNQLQLPAIAEVEHRLRTPSRTMSASGLRPGDYLRSPSGAWLCVLQNSAKLQRVELGFVYGPPLRFCIYETFVYNYPELTSLALVAHGRPRYWWAHLPKWLSSRVCPYVPLPR